MPAIFSPVIENDKLKNIIRAINLKICSSNSIKPSVKNSLLPQNAPLKGTYKLVNKTLGKSVNKTLKDLFCPQIKVNINGNKTTNKQTTKAIMLENIKPQNTICGFFVGLLAHNLEITSGIPLVTNVHSKKNTERAI